MDHLSSNHVNVLIRFFSMQEDSKREDLFNKYGGSGVIGRMADVLTTNGIPTNLFSIDGSQVVLIGETGAGGPSPFTLDSGGLEAFNQNPDFDTETIKILNRKGKADSGFFSETWSLLAEGYKMPSELDFSKKVPHPNVNRPFPTHLVICSFLISSLYTLYFHTPNFLIF